MDTGKGKQPAKEEVVAAASSKPTSQALRGSGSGTGNGNGNTDTEHVVVPRESMDSLLPDEHDVVVVHREVSMDSLILSLSPPMFVVTDDLNNVPVPPPPPPPAPVRAARQRNQQPREPNVPPPYPWATNQRATVHSLQYLMDRGIYTITGDVSCKKCRSNFTIDFNLMSKYTEMKQYIICFRDGMHDRAPKRWMEPDFPNCSACQYPHALRPTLGKKRAINWLFLMLGQMLGACSLAQLKYFCKHTNNHRTGAKDRLLFLTYLGICKQLEDIPAFHYPTQREHH